MLESQHIYMRITFPESVGNNFMENYPKKGYCGPTSLLIFID